MKLVWLVVTSKRGRANERETDRQRSGEGEKELNECYTSTKFCVCTLLITPDIVEESGKTLQCSLQLLFIVMLKKYILKFRLKCIF